MPESCWHCVKTAERAREINFNFEIIDHVCQRPVIVIYCTLEIKSVSLQPTDPVAYCYRLFT
jgi:hypothetical protein